MFLLALLRQNETTEYFSLIVIEESSKEDKDLHL